MILKIIFGFLSGLTASLGLGGGFFLLIYLTVFSNVSQQEAQATNIFFFIVIAIVSVVVSIFHKLVNFKYMIFSIVYGVFGVGLGLLIEFIAPVYITRKLFAIFLFIIGLKEIFYKKKVHD